MNQQTTRRRQTETLARSAASSDQARRTDHLTGSELRDPLVSRSAKAHAEEKEDEHPGRLHRSARGEASGHVAGAWERATAGGSGPVPYRREMERAFGQDFSGVRAYMGRREPMETIGAHAAANGEDVAFAEHSPSKRLVAHELTHVVQRRKAGGGSGGGVRGSMKVSQPGDAAEREADRVGEAVAKGGKVRVTVANSGGVDCSGDPDRVSGTARRGFWLRDGTGASTGHKVETHDHLRINKISMAHVLLNHSRTCTSTARRRRDGMAPS